MRRFNGLLAARLAPCSMALLAGCQTALPSPSATAGPPPELAVSSGVGGSSITYRLQNDDGGTRQYVNASPDESWRALIVAYNDLKIPVSALDNTSRRISSTSARAPRKLAGEPLHLFLDCGNGVSGPHVDSYDVAFELTSTVTPAAGDSSAIHTTLSASARSRGGVSSAPVACATTGRLEQRIAAAVRLKLPR